MSANEDKANFALIPRNSAFFIQIRRIFHFNFLAPIDKWEIGFSYTYNNSFGRTTGQGSLLLSGLTFNCEFSIAGGRRTGPHLKVLNMALEMGDSELSFSEGHILKMIGFLFNVTL